MVNCLENVGLNLQAGCLLQVCTLLILLQVILSQQVNNKPQEYSNDMIMVYQSSVKFARMADLGINVN